VIFAIIKGIILIIIHDTAAFAPPLRMPGMPETLEPTPKKVKVAAVPKEPKPKPARAPKEPKPAPLPAADRVLTSKEAARERMKAKKRDFLAQYAESQKENHDPEEE
jgi:hypothetical protein